MALTAVMRKLLLQLNAVAQRATPWVEHYEAAQKMLDFEHRFRRRPESSIIKSRRSLPRHVVSRGRHVIILASGIRWNDGM